METICIFAIMLPKSFLQKMTKVTTWKSCEALHFKFLCLWKKGILNIFRWAFIWFRNTSKIAIKMANSDLRLWCIMYVELDPWRYVHELHKGMVSETSPENTKLLRVETFLISVSRAERRNIACDTIPCLVAGHPNPWLGSDRRSGREFVSEAFSKFLKFLLKRVPKLPESPSGCPLQHSCLAPCDSPSCWT